MTDVVGVGPWRVAIIESERGYGQKVDGYYRFPTKEEAYEFAKDYNSENNKPYVPDWYMYAETPSYVP